jgi:hypothetical protein
MKITAIATMTIIAGAAGQAKITVGSTDRTVVVCMAIDARFLQARVTASKMFADIDVSILWRGLGRGCPEDGIQIILSDHTPDSLHPGALAYALLYEGTQIRVFYDRIAKVRPGLVPRVLALVLVHEITHILQRIARHSNRGVMKDHWDDGDLNGVRRQPLGFTEEDIDLIHRGLALRAARAWQPRMATIVPHH